MFTTLLLLSLLLGLSQVGEAARYALSENAVPPLLGRWDGVASALTDSGLLSALRRIAGSVFPDVELVVRVLIRLFFLAAG